MSTPNIDIKRISGILNTDDSNEVIDGSHHKHANNILFRNGRAESHAGSRLIPYSNPVGGQCISRYWDEEGGYIYWFIYNPLGNHSIWRVNLFTEAVEKIAEENNALQPNSLNFNLTQPITGVKILRGDTVNGDELWFINCQKVPCKINIQKGISGGYGVLKREYIKVSFPPPSIPPICVYMNDISVTVNTLRKKLFRVKLRFVNESKNKSVTSEDCEVPLPVNYIDTAIDKDPTKNCKIGILYSTGNQEVKKIEILIAESSNNTWLDYKLVKVIDKSLLGLANDDVGIYYFFNNEAYPSVSKEDTAQLFDLVPLGANDMAFANGNVPIYGGITEGYDPIVVTGSSTPSSVAKKNFNYPFIFKSFQSGNTAFGTGNIRTVLYGEVAIGQTFNIITTNETLSFTATAATTANIISGLSTAATTAGFTIVSSDANNLVIIKGGEALQLNTTANVSLAVGNGNVFDLNSRYNFVLQYFDENGITIGSQTTEGLSFQTPNYTETTGVMNVPSILLSITNRPPLEAKYFSIGRSLNHSKQRHFYWVSRETYKDKEYAYIGIENINSFIKKNVFATQYAYDFSPNDRIRFVKRLSSTTNTIYTDNDFEIQAVAVNPSINGEVKLGQFLKILLPSTSGTFDFGSGDFFNYFIQIYTPALLSSEEYQLYYEFGEMFAIGDAGTSTRHHQGGTQNQTSNLSQPATFVFTKGDCYLRDRKIETGGQLNYDITEGVINAGRHTIGVNFDSRDFTDTNITTGNSPLQDLSGWTFASNTRALIKMGASAPTTTFRAEGSIKIDPDVGDNMTWYFQDNTGVIYTAVSPIGLSDSPQTFPFNVTFNLGASQHISFVGYSLPNYSNPKLYASIELKITVERSYTVTVIDEHFSDYYPSKVNSNARAFFVDPNAKQSTYKNLLRWGLARDFDTNVNGTNRFKKQNATEVDLNKGEIGGLVARGNNLRVFQKNGVCWMGIYRKIVKDTGGGANILTATDEIITKNNFEYYKGNFGLGNQFTGLVSAKERDFFVDTSTGTHLMVSDGGGILPISNIYKGEYAIRNMLIPYNNNYDRPAGGKAKILGYYDYFNSLYVTVLQEANIPYSGNTIAPKTLAFYDGQNPSYTSFFDIYPEQIIGAENKVYAWSEGFLYVLDDTNNYCNFFGVQYYPSIRFVYNDKPAIRKIFNATGYESNQIWSSDRFAINTSEADSVITSYINNDTGLRQVSELKFQDYVLERNKRTASFLRDKNSIANALTAVLDGDYLEGYWLEIEYIYKGNEFAWFFMPQVTWQVQNRNF